MSEPTKFPRLLPFEDGDSDDKYTYVFVGRYAPFAKIRGVGDEAEAKARELIKRWNAYEVLRAARNKYLVNLLTRCGAINAQVADD